MVKDAGAAKIVPFVGEVIVTGGTAATKDERNELPINRKTTASQRVTQGLLIQSISAEVALCLSRANGERQPLAPNGNKVMRGGSYDYPDSSCRSASRLFFPALFVDTDLAD